MLTFKRAVAARLHVLAERLDPSPQTVYVYSPAGSWPAAAWSGQGAGPSVANISWLRTG